MTETEIRTHLVRLARKYGGANLIRGAAITLVEDCIFPEEFGVHVKVVESVGRAVNTTLAMASRAGGRRRLAEFIENGELELATSCYCECDESPKPLTGPVDIVHVQLDGEGTRIRHDVLSHLYVLAEFDTLAEALEFVKVRGLELDQTCRCGT